MTRIPPSQLPPGWQQPDGWWYDGRQWRPPVPPLTKANMVSQGIGALIKLAILIPVLILLVVFLWGAFFGK